MNKKALAVAVSGALAAPMAAHAVKYKLSGQINRAAVYQNDGTDTDIQFVDNISSGTRWRLTGSEDIGNGMKVGFNREWQNSQNPSNGGAPIGSGDFGEAETMRKAEVWFSGGWGKVSLGQGDGAGGTIGGGLTHGAALSHFDAFTRYDRIRYDSPALGPVTLAVSAGQADKYEGAARWSQGIGGGQISEGQGLSDRLQPQHPEGQGRSVCRRPGQHARHPIRRRERGRHLHLRGGHEAEVRLTRWDQDGGARMAL